MSLTKTVWFCVAQIIAAILASYSLKLLFPEAMSLGETLPTGSIAQTFVMEFILTFALMFVIINVATGSKEQGVVAGLAIGMTVMICALVGGPISGASMNPARSIGPAIANFDLQHLWIYICSPILGAAASIAAWKFIK